MCSVCKGRGWIIAAIDGFAESLAIQRCDECFGYQSDEDAERDEEAVHELRRAKEESSIDRER